MTSSVGKHQDRAFISSHKLYSSKQNYIFYLALLLQASHVLTLDLSVKYQLYYQGECVSHSFLHLMQCSKSISSTVHVYVPVCGGAIRSECPPSLSYGPISWPRGCKAPLGAGSQSSSETAINIHSIPVDLQT